MIASLLFVDDEDEIVETARTFFEEEGYAVLAADSARDGIALLKKTPPDVLVLDMKLPDQSGITVLQEVRRLGLKTKVIVNTGYVDQGLIDEAERLGCDAFLQKPFDLFVLKDEIDRLLGRPAS